MPFYSNIGTSADLRCGKKYNIKDVLFGLILPSGCDAAYFLAYNLGYFFHKEKPVVGFVEKMNAEAKKLGMLATEII